jgi:hypothetical protein
MGTNCRNARSISISLRKFVKIDDEIALVETIVSKFDMIIFSEIIGGKKP